MWSLLSSRTGWPHALPSPLSKPRPYTQTKGDQARKHGELETICIALPPREAVTLCGNSTASDDLVGARSTRGGKRTVTNMCRVRGCGWRVGVENAPEDDGEEIRTDDWRNVHNTPVLREVGYSRSQSGIFQNRSGDGLLTHAKPLGDERWVYSKK
jgi:hypothetical protein